MIKKICLFLTIFYFSIYNCLAENINEHYTLLVIPATIPERGEIKFGWDTNEKQMFNELLKILSEDENLEDHIINFILDEKYFADLISHYPCFLNSAKLKEDPDLIKNGYFYIKKSGVDFILTVYKEYHRLNQRWIAKVSSEGAPLTNPLECVTFEDLKKNISSYLKDIFNGKDWRKLDSFHKHSPLDKDPPYVINPFGNEVLLATYKGKNIEELPAEEAFKIKYSDLKLKSVQTQPTLEFLLEDDSLNTCVEYFANYLSKAGIAVLKDQKNEQRSKYHFVCVIRASSKRLRSPSKDWIKQKINFDVSSSADNQIIYSTFQIAFFPLLNNESEKSLTMARTKAIVDLFVLSKEILHEKIHEYIFDEFTKEIEKKSKGK